MSILPMRPNLHFAPLIKFRQVSKYVPFAVLPKPGSGGEENPRPLFVEHEVVNLPSASVLAVLRRELSRRNPAAKTVAVLADPVFDKDDRRVGVGIKSQGRQRKDTRRDEEAATISAAASLPSTEVERALKEVGVSDGSLRIPLPHLILHLVWSGTLTKRSGWSSREAQTVYDCNSISSRTTTKATARCCRWQRTKRSGAKVG